MSFPCSSLSGAAACLGLTLLLHSPSSLAKDSASLSPIREESSTILPKNFEWTGLYIQYYDSPSSKTVYELHDGKELSGSWLKNLEGNKAVKPRFATKTVLLKDEVIKGLRERLQKLKDVGASDARLKCDRDAPSANESISVNYRIQDGSLKMVRISLPSNPCVEATAHILKPEFDEILALLKKELPKLADAEYQKLRIDDSKAR